MGRVGYLTLVRLGTNYRGLCNVRFSIVHQEEVTKNNATLIVILDSPPSFSYSCPAVVSFPCDGMGGGFAHPPPHFVGDSHTVPREDNYKVYRKCKPTKILSQPPAHRDSGSSRFEPKPWIWLKLSLCFAVRGWLSVAIACVEAISRW